MYCSADDVQVRMGFPDSFAASTRPTLTQVNSLIEQVSAEIDIYLAKAGIASVTDAKLLLMLKLKASAGAACKVGFTYFGNNNPVENSQASTYCKEYAEFLDLIKTNPEF